MSLAPCTGHETIKRYPFLWLCLALAIPGTTVAEAPDGWYDQDRVEAGATLFARHCASCHGAAAQATPDWRKAGADHRYPPPPLNGTAHAWHHPLPMLRRTIARGGALVGGSMPAFGDSLDAAQIDAIIA